MAQGLSRDHSRAEVETLLLHPAKGIVVVAFSTMHPNNHRVEEHLAGGGSQRTLIPNYFMDEEAEA